MAKTVEELMVLLNQTDELGNEMRFNGREITLIVEGVERDIGWLHFEEGLIYYRKYEKEADRYRRTDAWSVAARILEIVDRVQYQSDARAYQIEKSKARLYGDITRPKTNLEEKIYIPVKAWEIFKSNDQKEQARIELFGVEWYNTLYDLIWSNAFNGTSSFLADRQKVNKVYPDFKYIFNAYKLTPLSKVRVVVMGNHPVQDSPTNGLAFGYELPFGRQPEIENIQNQLEKERIDGKIGGKQQVFMSEEWAAQGVMCLNATLSIEKGRLMTHEGHWDHLIERTLRHIQSKGRPVVFLLLGTWAHQYMRVIDRFYHTVITADAYSPNFIGSDVFSKANEALKKIDGGEITW